MRDEMERKTLDKLLYKPTKDPILVEVPGLTFVVIEGKGDPGGVEFQLATAALYSLSYAVRMSYKGKEAPEGWYEYKVYPLEGEWDLIDKDKSLQDKSNFKYRLMIRQPDFLTPELFERLLATVSRKKPNPFLSRLRLEEVEEGLCCQLLHVGPYDDEPSSFRRMESWLQGEGYRRLSRVHREIYLSDPRRTKPGKLKTLLRVQVERA